jgi:hypothetical protein
MISGDAIGAARSMSPVSAAKSSVTEQTAMDMCTSRKQRNYAVVAEGNSSADRARPGSVAALPKVKRGLATLYVLM